MPKISKDKEEKNNIVSSKKTPTKKQTSVEKNIKKEDISSKTVSNAAKKEKKPTTAKKVESKKINKNSRKSDKNSETIAKSKKSTASKTTKVVKAKKVATSKSKKQTVSKKKIEILEYYDLPYRYNQTVVKLLAQTPTTLFVYWDISDSDRENLIKSYGEKFFEETKPVLIIHNETNNYSFEVDINDFANSWYLHIPDSKCVYNIELGRRPIYKQNIQNNINHTKTNYIYITSSNELEAPNDHMLFDKLGDTVYFRNVKTNIIEGKKITSFSFIQNIGKIYNIYDVYKKMYPSEDIKNFDFTNPSSGNSSSFFK